MNRYELYGPRIESRWVGDFPHPCRPALGPPSNQYDGYRVSFPGVKLSRRDVNHPPSSSAEVKERVELYLYSPSGPSWPVLGQNYLCHHTHTHTRARAQNVFTLTAHTAFGRCVIGHIHITESQHPIDIWMQIKQWLTALYTNEYFNSTL